MSKRTMKVKNRTLKSKAEDFLANVIIGAFVIIFLGLVVGLSLLRPYMNMKAYNRVSDDKITLFEAVFTDVRLTPTKGGK